MISLKQPWFKTWLKTSLEQHRSKANDLLLVPYKKPFCSSYSDPQACFDVDCLVLASIPFSPLRNQMNTQGMLQFKVLL